MERNPFEIKALEPVEQRIENGVKKAMDGFELPNFVQRISFDGGFGPAISIVYTNQKDEVPSFKVRDLFSRLQDSLARNNLELGSLSGSGGYRETFMITELVVDGATNWRRWLPYPEKFDEEIQMLLDEAAQQVGQQEGGDRFSKFYNFLGEAEQKGLLSRAEVRHISLEMNKVAHI